MIEQNYELSDGSHQPRVGLISPETSQSHSTLVGNDAEKSFLSRHLNKILIGCAALSVGYTVVSDDLGDLKDDVVEAAPWIGTGVIASEVAFIGGLALMGASVGASIKNPLKLRQELPEMVSKANDSRLFKAGFWLNTSGAVGDFGVLSVGILKEMPPSSWGVLGLTLTDLAGTIGVRKWALESMKSASVDNGHTTGDVEVILDDSDIPPNSVDIRRAVADDVEGLVELDLSRFRKAYGDSVPDRSELRTMFQKRIENAGEWMYIVEIDNIIEGFITAYRTNKTHEEFISWEHSTNMGTLDGCVEENGRYVYIANMTMSPKAMKTGAENTAIVKLFAEAVKHGVEYEYFVSRMPLFNRWLKSELKKGRIDETDINNKVKLTEIAEKYSKLKKITKNGEVLYDPELRMYSSMGISQERVVENGFQDESSMNFGVVCKIDVPPNNRFIKKSKIVRNGLATFFNFASRHPKILERFGY